MKFSDGEDFLNIQQ